jgi:15,16-dihydrobiliverdin:ferredoxin oxidoreductase
MDEFLEMALKQIEKKFPIEPIPLPEELQRIKLPLGLIDLQCYNWKAAKMRKIFSFRLKAPFSFLDILVIGIYPESTVDLPLFDCEFNGIGKKVIPVFNFVPLFDDSTYFKKYIEPMKPIFEKYSHFQRLQAGDYLKPYLSPYCLFAKTDKTHLEEIKQYGLECLTLYIDLLSQAEEVQDPSYRDEIEKAHKKYIQNLITYDPSRKTLGRIIGKKRSDRIYNEIIV